MIKHPPFSEAAQITVTARLRLPEKLDQQGLLVGWSMEHKHVRRPIGFTFGDPDKTPETGYVDPILMTSEGHLMTLAPTGAGKGVGCIIPALLRHTGPVIVVDPKGENAAVTARRRRDMGQDVIILDPMGVTGEQGAQLNPLDLINPESATGVDDAAALAGALLPKEFSGDRNQYWWSRAQHLLIAAILHVATDLPAPERRLSKVREILNGMAAAPEKYAESMMRSRHPEVRLIHGNLVIGAKETLGSIISFAQEGVDFIRGPMVQQVTDKSSFSFEAVTRGQPLSIYLVLPPHMLDSHSRLLRLWISTLLTAVMRRRSKPELPTLFILDEAAQLGELPELRQAITLLRGYGLLTWSFWQDVSQLKLLYPHDWETMVNNCRTLQAFGANNMRAAHAMADLLGSMSGPNMLELESDEMLLQIAGDETVIARRPNYLTDPIFAGLFDPNPLFNAEIDPLPQPNLIREYLRPEKKAAALRMPGQDQSDTGQPRFGPAQVNPVDALLAGELLRFANERVAASNASERQRRP